MFYFQCVVSDGHTSTLAIVKGANVNIIETIKAKDLVKIKAGIKMSNFGLEKDGIRLNKSSSVKLCLDVSMLQHMYNSFCFVTFINMFFGEK